MKIVNPYLKKASQKVGSRTTVDPATNSGSTARPNTADPVKKNVVVQTSSSSSSSTVRNTPAPDRRKTTAQLQLQEPRRITPPSKNKSQTKPDSLPLRRASSHVKTKPTTSTTINPSSMRSKGAPGALKSKLKQQIQELKRQKKQEKLRKEMAERQKQEEARQRVLAEQRRKLEEKRQEDMRQRMLEEEAKRKQRAAEAEIKARRNEVKIVLNELCSKIVHMQDPPPLAPVLSYPQANAAPPQVLSHNQIMMSQPLHHHSLLHRPSYYSHQAHVGGQPFPGQQAHWTQQQQWMINQALYLQQWTTHNPAMSLNRPLPPPSATSSRPLPPVPARTPSAHKPKVPKPPTLSNNVVSDVMKPPSPFASTHELLTNNPIILWKEKGQSFGMSIQIQVVSTLVDPPADEPFSTNNKPLLSPNLDAIPTTQQNQPTRPSVSGSDSTTVPVTQLPESTGVVSVEEPIVRPKPRRRRRRRVNFAALVIMDPAKQNEKRKKQDSSKDFFPLDIGDIVVKINGKSTAGLAFEDCCALLRQELPNPSAGDSGWVSLPIEVARKRKPVTPPPSQVGTMSAQNASHAASRIIPYHFVPNPNTSTVIVTSDYLSVISRLILHKMTSCDRSSAPWVLGEGLLKVISILFERQSSSTIESLTRMWMQQKQAFADHGRSLALSKAKADWDKEEANANGTRSNLPASNFMSDAKRAVLKAKPRPRKGCKCGSLTHSFVSDPECLLYRNLRQLDESSKNDDDVRVAEKAKKLPKVDKSSLNKLGSHIVDRHERQLAEKRAEEEEARFVERMENIQLELCKQAIVAPSLTAMVLSAVSEIKEDSLDAASDVKRQAECTSKVSVEGNNANQEDIDESDDEEEEGLTLAELAKRSSTASSPRQKKKAKVGKREISLSCVAQMARFISKTWGHVAQEPSHVEYAWRWEVFHGQHSPDVTWDSRASNPRRPGSLTWEPIHLQIDDKIYGSLREVDQMQYLDVSDGHDMQRLLEGDKSSLNEEQRKAITCMACVLNPSGGTGLMDEIRALMKSGVLTLTEKGYLRLARHWYLNVDVLLLDEFVDTWGFDRRFLMDSKIVETLKKQWILTELGWASTAEPEDPIYDLAEFEEWKQAFEQKHETKSNEVSGINRFGI